MSLPLQECKEGPPPAWTGATLLDFGKKGLFWAGGKYGVRAVDREDWAALDIMCASGKLASSTERSNAILLGEAQGRHSNCNSSC